MPLPNPNLFKKDQSYDPVYGGLGFGGEEECITQRPTSTALFCISSVDRYSTVEQLRADTSTPYRFTITKNESLLNGFFTRLALSEIRFPFTLPNVASLAFTDKIGIQCGTDSHVITIDESFYSPTELATAIQTEWNTTYTTNTIAITIGNGLQFQIVSTDPTKTLSVYPLTPGTGAAGGTLPVNTYQLFDMMNFTDANITPTVYAPGEALQSGTNENLLWTDYVDIVANNLTYNQALKDSSTSQITRDIIYRVYLTNGASPFEFPNNPVTNNTTDASGNGIQYVGALPQGSRPFMIYRQFQNPKEIRWNKNQPIGQVTFEVYDDKGRCLADLFPADTNYSNSQSSDWNMTMLVSEN